MNVSTQLSYKKRSRKKRYGGIVYAQLAGLVETVCFVALDFCAGLRMHLLGHYRFNMLFSKNWCSCGKEHVFVEGSYESTTIARRICAWHNTNTQEQFNNMAKDEVQVKLYRAMGHAPLSPREFYVTIAYSSKYAKHIADEALATQPPKPDNVVVGDNHIFMKVRGKNLPNLMVPNLVRTQYKN